MSAFCFIFQNSGSVINNISRTLN